VFIRRKYGHKQLSQSTFLSEAEPFLEQYAKRSPQNQTLIGSAGNLVIAEDFLAIVEGGMDEEGDLETERELAPSSPSPSEKDIVPKKEGLIVFFPGKNICNWPKALAIFFNESFNTWILIIHQRKYLDFNHLVNLLKKRERILEALLDLGLVFYILSIHWSVLYYSWADM